MLAVLLCRVGFVNNFLKLVQRIAFLTNNIFHKLVFAFVWQASFQGTLCCRNISSKVLSNLLSLPNSCSTVAKIFSRASTAL